MAEFRIEPAAPDDLAYIRDSWRKSYRDSPRTGKWPATAYAVFIADLMDRQLKRSRVVVARPESWADGVLGWLCAEQQPDQFVLHYVLVRPEFRNEKVMTSLIKSLEPNGKLVFSCLRPPFSAYVQRLGFAFNPRAAS